MGLVMNRLGLTLHPVKTRLVDLRRGKESFAFLGCTFRKKRSIQRNLRWYFMQRWPSPKATKKLRDRVRELTSKRQSGQKVEQIIAKTGACASRLEKLFPDGERRPGVPQDGPLRGQEPALLAVPAGRAAGHEAGSIHRRSAIRDGAYIG
jgi:hypothetical protein